MAGTRGHRGFSLAEVLLAVATLAIGMIFIGGTFVVGVHFATVSTERTIAAVVAKEAFAKVRIFGVDRDDPNLAVDRQRLYGLEIGPDSAPIDASEGSIRAPLTPGDFAYPSTRTASEKQYYWSALCRRMPSDPNHSLQVTVFVSRKIGAATMYEGPAGPVDWPVPMRVGVSGAVGEFVLTIEAGKEKRINDGYTIVEDSGGEIYRVVERGGAGLAANQIRLATDKPWTGGDVVWTVPPPISGGKGPCIGVYQKVIRF